MRDLGIIIEGYARDFAAGIVPTRVSLDDNPTIAPEGPKINGQEATLSRASYFDASPKTRPDGSKKRISENAAAHVPTTSQNSRVRNPQPVKIAVHADMVKVSMSDRDRGLKDRPSHGGGIRGQVTGFSRASRLRMIEFMAKIRNPGSMMFLTMTFDDSVLATLDENLDKMFEAFRRRFERKYPTWAALWRMEEQDRKSGDYIGLLVPHYHFIICTGVHYEKMELDGLSAMFQEWGRQAWQEITASTDENHLIYGFDVSPLKSRKQAYYYVSKYVAKLEGKCHRTGRRWGRIGTFDCSVSQEISLDTEEYIVFRRLVKKWLKTRGMVPDQNAAPEDVEKWLIRFNRARKYSQDFGRNRFGTVGFTLFGLGDTKDGQAQGTASGFMQFIGEARRQVADRRNRERSYGD